MPPRFRDTAFFDKGENVVIKIPFTGFPKPKIKWYRENEVIESGSHFAVEVQVSYRCKTHLIAQCARICSTTLERGVTLCCDVPYLPIIIDHTLSLPTSLISTTLADTNEVILCTIMLRISSGQL